MTVESIEYQGLVARLEYLEREDCFLRRVVLVLIVMLAIVAPLLAVATKQMTHVVEASEFVLRDRNGHVRAVWSAPSTGESAIRLLDPEGGSRVSLSVNADGSPTLAMTDREEKYAAGLAVTEDGPQLVATDHSRRRASSPRSPAERRDSQR
jgi:hypothetical protein